MVHLGFMVYLLNLEESFIVISLSLESSRWYMRIPFLKNLTSIHCDFFLMTVIRIWVKWITNKNVLIFFSVMANMLNLCMCLFVVHLLRNCCLFLQSMYFSYSFLVVKFLCIFWILILCHLYGLQTFMYRLSIRLFLLLYKSCLISWYLIFQLLASFCQQMQS